MLLAYVVFVSFGVVAEDKGNNFVWEVLRTRQGILKRYAMTKKARGECSKTRFIVVTEYQFGRTGNQFLSFTHGVWFAERLNATFVTPKYMQEIFSAFDTTLTEQLYCFTKDSPPQGSEVLEITSEEIFFGFKVFQLEKYRALLPPLDIPAMSVHYLQVYSSLWCCPHEKLLRSVESIISTHLHGHFHYNSVHIRRLEGGCNKILAEVAKPSDLSPLELPLHRSEWHGNLHRFHPLCEMSYDFVEDILHMHKRNDSLLFVAHDGRGSVQAYQDHHAIFSHHLSEEHRKDIDTKFFDMLMCMHSDFFISNPRSTFSLQIFLMRSILGLVSVPRPPHNDFFMQKIPDDLVAQNRSLWVSWTSVLNVLQGNQVF